MKHNSFGDGSAANVSQEMQAVHWEMWALKESTS